MSPEDKKHTETRIAKDADEYVNKHFSGSDYAFLGYIAGATAEHERMEKEVLELRKRNNQLENCFKTIYYGDLAHGIKMAGELVKINVPNQ